jgi:preprotein translocase subunit SecE
MIEVYMFDVWTLNATLAILAVVLLIRLIRWIVDILP